MLLSRQAKPESGTDNRRHFAVYILIGILGLATLALLHVSAGNLEQEKNNKRLIREQIDAARFLEYSLQQRVLNVESLQAFMLATYKTPDFSEFDKFAASLMRFTPAAKGYGFGDAEGVLRHFYPAAGNEQAIGVNIYSRPGAPFLRKAISERRTTVSNPVKIVQGELSVVIRAPLFRDDRLLGHVQGVFEIDPLIAQIKKIVDQNIVLHLEDKQGQYFYGATENLTWTPPVPVTVGDHTWQLRAAWMIVPMESAWLARILIWFGGSLFLASLMFIVYRIQSYTHLLTRAVGQRTAALQESQRMITTLLSNLPGMVYRCSHDENWTMVYTSDGCQTLTGYSAEDFVVNKKISFQQLIHSDDLEVLSRKLDEAIAQKRPFKVIYRIITAQGETKWVWEQGRGVYSPQGELLALEGFITDINERHIAEEARQKSEARLSAIVRTALNVIIVLSPDHRILEFNPEAVRVYGRRREEVLGEDFIKLLLPQELWKTVEADLQDVAVGKETRGFENEITATDGSRRSIIWNFSRLDDNAGHVNGIVAIGHDISDYRRAVVALSQKQKLLSDVLEALPIGVWITDRAGKVISSNPAGQAIWAGVRYVGIEQYGEYKGWWAHTGKPIVAEEWALARAITKGETSINELIEIQCFDGTRKTVLNSAMPLYDADGGLQGAIVVNQDVTQMQQTQKALRENEDFLDRSQRVASVGSWEWDVVTQQVRWSEEMFRVYGMEKKDFDGTYASAIANTHPNDIALLERNIERVLRQGIATSMEFRILRPDGKARWVQGQTEPFFNAKGEIIRVIGTVRDITERKQAEEALWENEIRYRTLFEAAKDAIFLMKDGLFMDCNQHTLEMFGCQRHEIIGRSLIDFSPPYQLDGRPSKEKSLQKINAALGGEPQFFEWVHIHLDGTSFHAEVSLNAITLNNERYLHAIVRDISERMQAQEKLQYLAHHDSLTGLPNRAMFLERLDHALTRARWTSRPLAVLFLDLDRFKNINDTLGHDIGDNALRIAAQRLLDSVREGDTVARLGGDEFTVLLEDLASTDDVPVVAQKIIESVSQPFEVESREFVMTTSIGISLYPSDGDDSLNLLRNADTAMYRAKEQGRNKAQFYSAEMGVKAFEKFMLESNLRHALERNEFQLYYQPQVDLATGAIIGVETLLRWRHPELGMVTPAQFIPVAEETGLMKNIDEWVLRTACLQSQAWRSAGLPPLVMAVNLSGAVFSEHNLIDIISRLLGESCMAPGQLELEITERTFMQNAESTVRILGDLRKMGIRLAIDDFGTGYSSLSYLKRFPIDTLKIDQSFLQDMTDSDDNASLVKAIIVMGHALNHKVIAEGVETTEQLAFLRQEGCDGMQGFLFSRPLPVKEITRLIKSGNKQRA
ncbi:MAG TPA: EAL domain-containing protein [Sulfuricaulis sp.]